MELTINQQKRQLPENIETIEALREHYQLTNTMVMIEHNGHALPLEKQNETKIAAGDTIEIVRFVGGG